jgi:hypothetical protein
VNGNPGSLVFENVSRKDTCPVKRTKEILKRAETERAWPLSLSATRESRNTHEFIQGFSVLE